MLVDQFGRTIDYVRISVTDKCDLRCTYCIPEGFRDFEVPQNWLTFDELTRIIRNFTELGVKRFRLTGGEPLLRKDLPELVASIKAIDGVEDLSMTTNATQLEKHAVALKEAGLDRLNISLDGLTTSVIKEITGLNCFNKVYNGIMAAKNAGFKQIKINMVPMLNLNDNQIEPMIAFCIEHGFILRMIEVMPMGDTGRNTQGKNLSDFLKEIYHKYDLVESMQVRGGGPARYWQSKDGKFTLGLITPISQHFCETCNRVRLSVDGTLYMCLGQNEQYALRDLVRSPDCTDESIKQAIRQAIDLKPEKHEFVEDKGKIARFMSMTGG
ncbi:GTP 3',8-cyclase MoaA [Wohlfahrtiimonas chitiniclastica]|uniref:GTP 3',8-cyclase n=1 Tax=Wohlfahrtiimonas chitiniclastica TaxID=400946 RepID=A0AB35BXQ1_9GAMM|nr:GTP 3',8-cyclase MoaA [Wohlfahrtiimonas chitiniclastica]MBS7824529.1 GTP 3',8-cyclase MoaA [Wohlfahrtiimonas chitiniclastica]MBS7839992.1 GTP 3',8-cyclase MoaA [Wohlfahrtiimonas chitiniclastica]